MTDKYTEDVHDLENEQHNEQILYWQEQVDRLTAENKELCESIQGTLQGKPLDLSETHVFSQYEILCNKVKGNLSIYTDKGWEMI